MYKLIKKISLLSLATSLVVFSQQPALAVDTYEIDAKHSTLGFAVKHLQVGTTRGGFTDYSGTISYDKNDVSLFSANVTIQVVSIDSKVEARDNHLRGPDFFDVENHPTITFNNARLEKRGEGAVIIGDLTIKGITKNVTIPASVSGPVKSPMGTTVIGINGQTNINRQDFGVSWSKSLDSGGLVVDDNVILVIELEAHKKG